MVDQLKKHGRGLDSYNPKLIANNRILVAGCGGSGSTICYALAKLDLYPIAVDFDHVEEHNLGSQFFSPNQIGMFKTDATWQNVHELTGNEIGIYSCKYEKRFAENCDIIIMAVDVDEVREQIVNDNPDKWIIDIGQLMDRMNMFIIPTGKPAKDRWLKFHRRSEKTEATVCTARASAFMPLVTAGYVAYAVIKILMHRHEQLYNISLDLKTGMPVITDIDTY
jgi:hypothetical protein